ncbi:hypothetical protein H8D85_02120 [bacterium]|nr:hypothetical protein [bacterium]
MGEAISGASDHTTTSVPLAIVYLSGTTLNSAYTYDMTSIDLKWSVSNGVLDLRSNFVLTLRDSIIDEDKLLFKDRDSTEATDNPVSGKVTFQNHVHINEDLTLSSDKSIGIGFAETDDISDAQVHIKGASHLATLKVEQTESDHASKIFLSNTENSFGIFGDSSPNELRLGRYLNEDIQDFILDSSGNISVSNSLTVKSTVLHEGTTYFNKDLKFKTGAKLGIGFEESDNINYTIHAKASECISVFESTLEGKASKLLLNNGTNSYGIAYDPVLDILSLGRTSSSNKDLYIDSSGNTFIENNLYVDQEADFTIGGILSVNNTLKVGTSDNLVILGNNTSTLSGSSDSVNIYFEGKEAVQNIISKIGGTTTYLNTVVDANNDRVEISSTDDVLYMYKDSSNSVEKTFMKLGSGIYLNG